MNTIHGLIALLVSVSLSCSSLGQTDAGSVLRSAVAAESAALDDTQRGLWARAANVAFRDRVAEARVVFGQLEDRAAGFRADLTRLLTDDRGKRLGRDPAAVIEIAHLRRAPLVTELETAAQRAVIDAAADLLTAMSDSPLDAYVPDPSVMAGLEDAVRWATSVLRELDETEAWISDQTASDGGVDGLPTLERRVTEYLAARRASLVDARERGMASAFQEATDQQEAQARHIALLEATFERERRLGAVEAELAWQRARFDDALRAREVETRRFEVASERGHAEAMAEADHQERIREADLQRFLASSRAQTAAIVAEAEREVLVARCNDPRVLAVLAPFTTHGRWQPGDRLAQRRVSSAPMSYSALVRCGALLPGEDGLVRLLQIANATGFRAQGTGLRTVTPQGRRRHLDTVRPKWGYPNRATQITDRQLDEVARVQSLLRELGPTLVELGLLSD